MGRTGLVAVTLFTAGRLLWCSRLRRNRFLLWLIMFRMMGGMGHWIWNGMENGRHGHGGYLK